MWSCKFLKTRITSKHWLFLQMQLHDVIASAGSIFHKTIIAKKNFCRQNIWKWVDFHAKKHQISLKWLQLIWWIILCWIFPLMQRMWFQGWMCERIVSCIVTLLQMRCVTLMAQMNTRCCHSASKHLHFQYLLFPFNTFQ